VIRVWGGHKKSKEAVVEVAVLIIIKSSFGEPKL